MSAAKKQNAIRDKYRSALRKEINKEEAKLTLDSISSMENLEKLAKYGEIVEASATGILIAIKREDFVSKDLRANLNIDQLIGKEVFFNIHEMDLEISGKVARTKFLGKKGFLVAVDYSSDSPEYWRECLMDMLPTK
jgi:ATP-dependent helicase/DNAse subunit B